VARVSDIVLLRKIKIRDDWFFSEYHIQHRMPIIFSNRFDKIDYAFFYPKGGVLEMSSELSVAITGLGGWAGMIVGILYIYNKNAEISLTDFAIIASAPVAMVASIRIAFMTIVTLLGFTTNVYATMLNKDVQLVSIFMILSSVVVSGILHTMTNLDKLRENQVTDENTENEDTEQDAEEDTEQDAEEDTEQDAEEHTVQDAEVDTQDAEGDIQDAEGDAQDAEGDIQDAEGDTQADTERDEEHYADDERDADSDKDGDNNEQRVQYADDIHDYKYETVKPDVTPVAKAFADMYRRLYGVMFVN
jgi:hypothetical protein